MQVEVFDNDAGGFIEQVEACANGVVKLLSPQEFILVRINNWFGPKWLPFSAPTTKPDESIAAKNLSLPLFVPNRVIAQRNFMAPTYTEYMGRESVHVQVRTSHARQRLMSDLPSGIAIAWYSGQFKSHRAWFYVGLFTDGRGLSRLVYRLVWKWGLASCAYERNRRTGSGSIRTSRFS